MGSNYEIERREAVMAGKCARNSLQNALDALNSARGWGIYDIIGGGLISTLIKQSKMDKACRYIEEAKENLKIFDRELSDIMEYVSVDISTEDVWKFADWFFDGIFSDWVIQGRINETRNQVQRAIDKVDEILDRIQ